MRIERRLILSCGMAVAMSIAAIASYADETCNSPYMSGLIKEQLGRPHHMKFTANPQRVTSLLSASAR